MEEKKIKYGVIHCHTDNSKHDSTLTVEQLVNKAVELGSPAVTLTDHGTMMGIDDFMNECSKKKIKGIPGVEAYYEEDGSIYGRDHLILLAKDTTGLKAIGKVVTDSNTRIDSKGYPRVNMKILEERIGEGSEGHGHVVMTSACVGGILSKIILSAEDKREAADKIKASMSKMKKPSDRSYVRNKSLLEETDKKLADAKAEKEKAKSYTKVTTKKKVKTAEIAKNKGDIELYNKLTNEIEESLRAAEEANKRIDELNSLIAKLNTNRKDLKERVAKDESDHEKYYTKEQKLRDIESEIKSDEELYSIAKTRALEFQKVVGKDNFYIELQNHGIPAEAISMPKLAKMARELNIPVVAANDVHILDNSENSIKARELISSLRYNKWSGRKVGDDQLYMKTDDELSSSLREIIPSDIVDEAMLNVGKIVDECNVVMVKEEHYPKYISDRNETADEALRRMAYEGIDRRFPNSEDFTEEYMDRLEYELDVITQMGYSDYHLIVQDFLNFGRKLGKVSDENLQYIWDHIKEWSYDDYVNYVDTHMTEIGYSIGPGRGSAAGSLVCYLLGITSIDPIKYGLIFERFLNKERVSMPDIDSDLSPRVRDLVIEYVKKRYGKNAVCCIMTRGTQKPKASIRSVARVLGSRDDQNYYDIGDKIARDVPNDIGTNFEKCYDDLANKYHGQELEMEIIDDAVLLEDRLNSIGMHAAGVIISDGKPVSDYVPLMWDEKKSRWKTQCDMIQAEGRGLLKMDFLGLNNLNIITDAIRLIRDRYGEVIDVENLPFEKEVFENIYAKGFTNSVFQFESGGMKDMLKQFKPESIEDVILLVAAYRPGPMDFIPDIIKVKSKVQPATYEAPQLKEILDSTYGHIVYQEQVMKIVQELAGYTLGRSDIVRRAMSKKHADEMARERKNFVYGNEEEGVKGCIANGISEKAANQIYDKMVDFAKYAFNKSHAAAYAIVSYQTAWLKYHYPKEYFCAVMSNVPITKIPNVMVDCKKLGIKVSTPSINESISSFSVKDDKILFGLSSVKRVGNSAEHIVEQRNQGGPFISIKDYVKRAHINKGVTEALIDAGAFDSFGRNRDAMKSVIEPLNEYNKKIKEKEKLISEIDEEIASLENSEENGKAKKLKTLERRRNNAILAKENAEDNYNQLKVPSRPENQSERLKNEKEMLGIYVSAHPLDSYESAETLGCSMIGDLEAGSRVKVIGLISQLRKTMTKRDKAPIAFFTLEDRSGEIETSCFQKAYAEYGKFVKEDSVVIIEGECKEEESFTNDSEKIKKLIVSSIKKANSIKSELVLSVDTLEDYCDAVDEIKSFQEEDGHSLIIHIKDMGEFRSVDYKVSSDIMTAKTEFVVKERNSI